MSDQEPTEVTPPPGPEPEVEAGVAPEREPTPEPEAMPGPEAGDEPTTAAAAPAAARPRRLERSQDDRVIAGVCGGLGEYLGVDAVLIRIAALVLVFAGGAGLLLYAIGWIAMPEAEPGAVRAPDAPLAEQPPRGAGPIVLGLVFVVLGAFFLVDEIWSDFLAWKYIWPIALIAVGAVVLLRARQ
jgi:phage shock protein PspC (stress-responsive transcriptional regulator)